MTPISTIRVTPILRAASILGLGLVGILVHGAPAAAQAKLPDQISMYVGYPPGGSFDSYVRTMARTLPKYLPGTPTIVVKYMPGGGSRKLAEYLDTKGAKDGSEFGQLNRSILFNELLTGQKEETDARRFAFVGSPSDESLYCFVWHGSSVKSLDDARKRDVPLGATNPTGNEVMVMAVANRLLGTRFKPIAGYQGGSEQNLAIERGEIEGRCWPWGTAMATKSDWIKDGKTRPLLQASLTRNPNIPDVPLLNEVVADATDKEALKVVFADQQIGHPVVLPPATPAPILAVFREAFDKTMKDADFLAEADKAKLNIAPLQGAAIESLMAGVYGQPPTVIERARTLIKTE